MTTVSAAVLRTPGGPWTIEEIELDDPRDDEVLVRIVASGICHTDLSIRDQFLPMPLPAVLGHEGAGIVEKTGRGVKGLKAGDAVVLAPLSCGCCGNCAGGKPMYCEAFLPLNLGSRRADGSATLRDTTGEVSGAFFGQSSFATHALANERNAIRVPNELPLELLGPLGCGIQTGAGTVLNALAPPAGSSLAVFGTGAVGLSAIMAARLVGCAPIIAVDIRPQRLELARELGATHAVDNSQSNATSAIRRLGGNMSLGSRGVDFTIDTTAVPAVIRQAVDCLAIPGTAALVGLPRAGTEISLDLLSLGNGKTVRGVIEGESVPSVLIPRLIELWRQDRFPFDRLIHRYPFSDINRAAADMEAGAVVKPVLTMS